MRTEARNTRVLYLHGPLAIIKYPIPSGTWRVHPSMLLYYCENTHADLYETSLTSQSCGNSLVFSDTQRYYTFRHPNRHGWPCPILPNGGFPLCQAWSHIYQSLALMRWRQLRESCSDKFNSSLRKQKLERSLQFPCWKCCPFCELYTEILNKYCIQTEGSAVEDRLWCYLHN